MHYVPTDQGLKNIVEEINSCVDDAAFFDVGKLYYDHYIWACALLFPNFHVNMQSSSDALTSSSSSGKL
jgi:hypothetical protein